MLTTLAGWLCLLAGCAVIAGLPLTGGGRLALLLAWLVLAGRDLAGWRRARRQLTALHWRADGSISAVLRNGICAELELLPGALVMARRAWLGGRTDDGRCYRAWFSQRAATAADWRRFQVLWRLRPRVAGRRDVTG